MGASESNLNNNNNNKSNGTIVTLPKVDYASQNYWTGPYGMKVPESVQHVVASDGYNTRHKDGSETEMFMMNAPKMNKDIYLAKYATLGDDGNYYYK